MSFRADAEIAVQVLHENGGFSLTRDGQAADGKGYFAAYDGYEEQTPLEKFSADSILAFRQRNFQLLADSTKNMIGGWLHDGHVYLDLSRAFDKLQDALEFAKANNQLAIWDGFEGKEIMVSEHTSASVGMLVAKLKAMFTHPILAPGLADDDAANVEAEDDDDLAGWNGLLTGDLFQPAFASYPPGAASTLNRMAGDSDDFDFALPDEDSGEENVYKWVWNKDDGILLWLTDPRTGRPPHDQVAIQNWGRKTIPGLDWLGYAIPLAEEVQLEPYKSSCPLHVLQEVKKELAKVEPHKPIVLPDYATHQDAFGVEIVDPPKESARRDRRMSAEWAQASFGDGTAAPQFELVPQRRSIAGFSALGFMLKKAEADTKGCMVALYVPTKLANDLAVKGGEPAEDLHITLAYFEEKGADRDDWDKAIEIARGVALTHTPLKGTISGSGIFHMDDGDVLWAAPSVPGLAEFRTDLVDAFNRASFTVSDTYGYQPHITLKYNFKGKPPRLGEEKYELDFDAAYFVVEEKRTKLKLGND